MDSFIFKGVWEKSNGSAAILETATETDVYYYGDI